MISSAKNYPQSAKPLSLVSCTNTPIDLSSQTKTNLVVVGVWLSIMNNQDRNQLKNSDYPNIFQCSSPFFGPFFMFSSSYFSLRHDKPLSWVVLRGEVCSVGPGFTSLSLSHLAITSITQVNSQGSGKLNTCTID